MSFTSDEPMFERKSEPLLSRWQFVGRMSRAFGGLHATVLPEEAAAVIRPMLP